MGLGQKSVEQCLIIHKSASLMGGQERQAEMGKGARKRIVKEDDKIRGVLRN